MQNSKLRVLQEVVYSTYFRREKMLQVRLHGRPRYRSCKAGDAFNGSMLRRKLVGLLSSKDFQRNSKEMIS